MSGINGSWDSFREALDSDDEFERDELAQQVATNRDAIVFLIDYSPSTMKATTDTNEPFVKAVFSCVQTVMLRRIMDRTNDLIGVVVYGTEGHENALDYDNITVVESLNPLDLPAIQKIKPLAKSVSDGGVDLQQQFGTPSTNYELANAFLVCNNLFEQIEKKVLKRKRVFLVTDEDNPHGLDGPRRSAALTRARDLQERGVELHLFSVSRDSEPFNFEAFYAELIGVDKYKHIETRRNFEVFLAEILKRESPRRATFSTLFRLFGDDARLNFGVKGYPLALIRKRPGHTWAYAMGGENKPVQGRATYICSDTNEPLMEEDMKGYLLYGGEKIVFTTEEQKALKSVGDIGFTLIGFKPEDKYKLYYNFMPPYFLYPDEESYKGSTRTFAALHKQMLEMKKIAICSFKQRAQATPFLCVLKPQAEILHEDGRQILPPGFVVVRIPYKDDVRPTPKQAEEPIRASDDFIDACLPIIEDLRIRGGYRPDSFKNPALAKFYHVLAEIALGEELEVQPKDDTVPKHRGMHKRIGEKIKVFNSKIEEAVELEASTTTASTSSSASRATSRTISRSTSNASDASNLQELWEAGRLDRATVAQLKAFLTQAAITPERRKADLIRQVQQYFQAGSSSAT
ncbi:7316_t:CDS:10 [Paraglomus brasilianum]|uniref:ATP-dependent DNA helicase II subunit 1 n=1 Tax=Paraglomus brasilianum TaxID=144538 RepID=A0A9N9C6H8_9GLOM|nr:7316_t:CDS:10 [Paraglomus brasilianum]